MDRSLGQSAECRARKMPTLATWIRETDEPFFARWFAERADLVVRNARRDPELQREGRPALPAKADGLLLSGGPDIGVDFLRQPVPDPSLIEEPQFERDRWEFAATGEAIERGLPVFAICKGVQVLNVALGGTLHLHIPGHAEPPARLGNIQPISFADAAPPHTRFERVNSSHHQALDRLGDGLEVEAWSPDDKIVEQVRRRGEPFCFGVQYHPERHEQYAPLFEDFFSRLTAR